MPDGFDRLRKKRDPDPQNRSRIIIEGIDEPKHHEEGRYSDRVRIDPFAPTYRRRAGAPAPVVRT